MSIDELVTKSGIPKGTLSKITAGISTNPTLSTVEAICLALECSLNEAVGYVERNQITSQEKMYIKNTAHLMSTVSKQLIAFWMLNMSVVRILKNHL